MSLLTSDQVTALDFEHSFEFGESKPWYFVDVIANGLVHRTVTREGSFDIDQFIGKVTKVEVIGASAFMRVAWKYCISNAKPEPTKGVATLYFDASDLKLPAETIIN